MFTDVAKGGAMSYVELKRLDAIEFFHVFDNWAEDMKRKNKQNRNKR